jgi:hypothetical protein
VATTVRRLRYFAASRRRRLGPIGVVPWEWSNFLRSCVRGPSGRLHTILNAQIVSLPPDAARRCLDRSVPGHPLRPSRLVSEAPEALLDLIVFVLEISATDHQRTRGADGVGRFARCCAVAQLVCVYRPRPSRSLHSIPHRLPSRTFGVHHRYREFPVFTSVMDSPPAHAVLGSSPGSLGAPHRFSLDLRPRIQSIQRESRIRSRIRPSRPLMRSSVEK